MDISAIGGATPTTSSFDIEKAIEKSEQSGFSTVLAETLENEIKDQAIMATGALSGDGLSGVQDSSAISGMQSMIFASAATGEIDDTQLALFMLCSMLQSSENSEMAPLMNIMAAVLAGMDSGSSSQLRETVMQSDYEPYVLDTVDREVFGSAGAGGAVKGAIVPGEAWKPTTPAAVSEAGGRSAGLLDSVISQFDVVNSERYRPYRKGNDTYCNIFVWDVTSALGCEIPHYVDSGTGRPRSYPDIKGAYELDANGTHDWLVNSGAEYGWREVSAEEAQAWANVGGPAVTAWKNPTGRAGHVQVVCPSESGGYDALRGVSVAQAGSKNAEYTYESSVFSSSQRSAVRYFVHA